MDLATNQHSINFIHNYICEYEIDQFARIIARHFDHTVLGEIIMMQCTKTDERYESTPQLKESISTWLKNMPQELLAVHGIANEARVIIDSYNIMENDSETSPFQSLSNKEIEELWKIKRKQRKFRERIIAADICLKRSGLPGHLISENILKKIKHC